MNKKLIAVAVAGVVAAPAAYAEISAYGRIHNHIASVDSTFPSDDDTMRLESEYQNVNNSGSRFGFKGSSDLGNGMNAFARYEFGTTTDTNAGGVSNRLSFVGLSGGFGSVSIGQQWSAYYQNVGTYASPNIANGPGQQLGPFRTGNTIQYANSMGPISFKIDGRVDDQGYLERKDGEVTAPRKKDGQGNGFGFGATVSAIDNVTLGLGYNSVDGADGTDTLGFSGNIGLGAFNITLSHEQQDEGMLEHTNTLVAVSAKVGKITLSAAVGQTEYDKAMGPNDEEERANASATYNFGGGLRTWVEVANVDTTETGGSDQSIVAVGLRMDF